MGNIADMDPVDETLSPEQRERIRGLLMRAAEQAREREGELGVHEPSWCGDVVDQTEAATELQLQAMLTESERRSIERIEHAMRRLDDGSYGRCEHCQQPIDPRRLDVAPWATTCVGCP
ncbi:RNA polymerase-binding protein DksA [Aeromicrobium halocynthiae]|uniref:RNA polymerase-binding protein DksA n=2 Tax=Aeromicrobium halocynthiae TaxID=560557 RepID=A0ABN2W881_9ACTN